MTHFVIRGTRRVFSAMGDLEDVIRPMYRLTSWNPRKLVVQTRNIPLFLDYAFVDSRLWPDVYKKMRDRGLFFRRLMLKNHDPLFVEDSIVVDLISRSENGEWDVDRSKPYIKKEKSAEYRRLVKIPVGSEVFINVSSLDVLCVIESSDKSRVVVRPVGSILRVVVE